MLARKSFAFFSKRNFFLFALVIIIFGLPLSKFLMSVGQLLLLIAWLIDGDLKNKLVTPFKNRVSLALILLFLLHIVGLLYTTNYEYGLNDIRIKLPLLIIPLLLPGFKPLNKKEQLFLLKLILAAVVIATLICSGYYLLNKNNIVDYREISLFISHIRFSLMIVLSIFISLYLSSYYRSFFYLIPVMWLIGFLFVLQSFTGIIIFLICLTVGIYYYLFRAHKKLFIVGYTILLMLITTFFAHFLKTQITSFYNPNAKAIQVPEYTEDGEKYYHDDYSHRSHLKENGYYVLRNVAWKEIEEAWNKRSAFPYDSLDLKGQEIKETLIRFLSSKGVPKNKETVNALTKEEQTAIEKGIPNYKYLKYNPIQKRIHQIIWEIDDYIHGGDYNGHSVILRWIYWKTGWQIFKDSFWTGVGTGDVEDVFFTYHKNLNPDLKSKYLNRAHNQYLTFAISFGIFGLLYFIYVIIFNFPIKNIPFFIVSFWLIAILSMVNEDTLETQAGVTFIAFYYCLLGLHFKDLKPKMFQ